MSRLKFTFVIVAVFLVFLSLASSDEKNEVKAKKHDHDETHSKKETSHDTAEAKEAKKHDDGETHSKKVTSHDTAETKEAKKSEHKKPKVHLKKVASHDSDKTAKKHEDQKSESHSKKVVSHDSKQKPVKKHDNHKLENVIKGLKKVNKHSVKTTAKKNDDNKHKIILKTTPGHQSDKNKAKVHVHREGKTHSVARQSKKKAVPETLQFDQAPDGGGANKCNKPLDLIIALDSSESVREANWTKLITFSKNLVETLDLNMTRIAVIRYNTNPEVPIPLGFFQSNAAFSATLDRVFYEAGGTRTDNALSKALLVFASGGARRASKVLVVVTDNPTNDIRLAKDNLVVGKKLVEKASQSLKNYEVTTFGVGIKYSLTELEREAFTQELKTITQDEEGEKRIVEVENFEDLLSSSNKVAAKICLVNGGWSKWSPWSQCTASCGGGTKVRLRQCDNPKPANNGTNCTDFGGSSVETAMCNVFPCTGLEITSMTQQAMAQTWQTPSQKIMFSKDCPNGFDYVYLDNNQLSASSVYTENTGSKEIMLRHAPENGKLDNVLNAGAWCAERSEATSNSDQQYIQIDLKAPMKIGKVATQGQASYEAENWVTFYKFNYSIDGKTWQQYGKLLEGNKDRLSLRENLITPPVVSRYVRFNAIHWNYQRTSGRSHDICMRVGVYKCKEEKVSNPIRKKIKKSVINTRKYQLP